MSAESLSRRYEVVVVGGGPAGVAGALRAAFLGRRALLVDAPYEPGFVDGRTGVDPFLGGMQVTRKGKAS